MVGASVINCPLIIGATFTVYSLMMMISSSYSLSPPQLILFAAIVIIIIIIKFSISTPTHNVRRHHHHQRILYLHPNSHCSPPSPYFLSPPQLALFVDIIIIIILSSPHLTLFAKIRDSTDFSKNFFKIPIF